MPISRNNRLHYTSEQYERAKQNNNALAYAQSHGYELVQEGRYYHLKEHDSLVFTPNGAWFWNSRGIKGYAIDFIVQYEGRSWAEAILILAGETTPRGSPQKSDIPPVSRCEPQEKPVFQLPPHANDERQLFAYLCGTRKISYDIVKMMLSQGIVYESLYRTESGEIYRTKSGRELHNACFVSLDRYGKPRSAFQRGLISCGNTAYKGEISGGDKSYGWVFRGRKPEELYAFEAAIDAASFVNLQYLQNQNPLGRADYLALGGLIFDPIQRYLEEHPGICCVHLMLDADKWGMEAAERFRKKLEEEGYQVTSAVPPHGKDWNDTLRYVKDSSMCSRIGFT